MFRCFSVRVQGCSSKLGGVLTHLALVYTPGPMAASQSFDRVCGWGAIDPLADLFPGAGLFLVRACQSKENL